MSSWRAHQHPHHKARRDRGDIVERPVAPQRTQHVQDLRCGHMIAKKLFQLIGDRSGGQQDVLKKLVLRAEQGRQTDRTNYDDELSRGEQVFDKYELNEGALMPHQAECIEHVLKGLSEAGEGRVSRAHLDELLKRQKSFAELMFNINGRAHCNRVHRGTCYDTACDVVMPNMGTVKVATGGGKTIISGVINMLPLKWFTLPNPGESLQARRGEENAIDYFLYPSFPDRLHRRAMVTCSSGALDEHRFMYQGYLEKAFEHKLADKVTPEELVTQRETLHVKNPDGTERMMTCSEMSPFLHRNAINLIRVVPALMTKIRTRYRKGDSKHDVWPELKREVPTDPKAYLKHVFPPDDDKSPDIREVSLYFLLSQHTCVYKEEEFATKRSAVTFDSLRYRRAAIVLFSLSGAHKDIASAYCQGCDSVPCQGVLDDSKKAHNQAPIVPPEDFAICVHDEPWREMSTQDITENMTDLEHVTKRQLSSNNSRNLKRCAAFEFAGCKLAFEITATGKQQRMYCEYPYAKLAQRGIVPQIQVIPISTFVEGDHCLSKNDENAALLRAVLCLDFVRDLQKRYTVPVCAICATHSVELAWKIKKAIDSYKREHPFLPRVLARIEVLESRLPLEQKKRIMEKFRAHQLDMLVVFGMGAEGISNAFLKVVMIDRHLSGARLTDDWYTQLQGRGRRTPADKLKWLVDASANGTLAKQLTDEEDRGKAGWTKPFPRVEFTEDHARNYFEKQLVTYLIPNEVVENTEIMQFLGKEGQGWEFARCNNSDSRSQTPDYDTIDQHSSPSPSETGHTAQIASDSAGNTSIDLTSVREHSSGNGKRAAQDLEPRVAKRIRECGSADDEVPNSFELASSPSMNSRPVCQRDDVPPKPHTASPAPPTASFDRDGHACLAAAQAAAAPIVDPFSAMGDISADRFEAIADRMLNAAEQVASTARQPDPDPKEELEGLLRDNQWDVVRNDANGHCLYYAVLNQLNEDLCQIEVQRLRKKVADFLRNKERQPVDGDLSWDNLWELTKEESLPLEHRATDWGQLLTKIASSDRWGDCLELQAIAYCEMRPIHVYLVRNSQLKVDKYNKGAREPPMTIAYYSKTLQDDKEPSKSLDVSHYFSIRKLGSGAASMPSVLDVRVSCSDSTGQHLSTGSGAACAAGGPISSGNLRHGTMPLSDLETAVAKHKKEKKKNRRDQDVLAVFDKYGPERSPKKPATYTDERKREECEKKKQREQDELNFKRDKQKVAKEQGEKEGLLLKEKWERVFCEGSQLQVCCDGTSTGVYCRKADAGKLVVKNGKPMIPEVVGARPLAKCKSYIRALDSKLYARNKGKLLVSYYKGDDKPPGAQVWPRPGVLRQQVMVKEVKSDSGDKSQTFYVPLIGRNCSQEEFMVIEMYVEFTYQNRTCKECSLKSKDHGGKISSQMETTQFKGNAQRQLVERVETLQSEERNAILSSGKQREVTHEHSGGVTTVTSVSEGGECRKEEWGAPLRAYEGHRDASRIRPGEILVIRKDHEAPLDNFRFALFRVISGGDDGFVGHEMLMSGSHQGIYKFQFDCVQGKRPNFFGDFRYHDVELSTSQHKETFRVNYQGISIGISSFGKCVWHGCRLLHEMVRVKCWNISEDHDRKPQTGNRVLFKQRKKVWWGTVVDIVAARSMLPRSGVLEDESTIVVEVTTGERTSISQSKVLAFHEETSEGQAAQDVEATLVDCLGTDPAAEGEDDVMHHQVLLPLNRSVNAEEGLLLNQRDLAVVKKQMDADSSVDPRLMEVGDQ